jgi:hypothetical protein
MSSSKVQEFLNQIGENPSLQTDGKDLGNKLRWQSWRLSLTSH